MALPLVPVLCAKSAEKKVQLTISPRPGLLSLHSCSFQSDWQVYCASCTGLVPGQTGLPPWLCVLHEPLTAVFALGFATCWELQEVGIQQELVAPVRLTCLSPHLSRLVSMPYSGCQDNPLQQLHWCTFHCGNSAWSLNRALIVSWCTACWALQVLYQGVQVLGKAQRSKDAFRGGQERTDSRIDCQPKICRGRNLALCTLIPPFHPLIPPQRVRKSRS